MRFQCVALAAALVGSIAASNADAAESITYNFGATNRNPGQVQQFGPLLGTLTGIQIDWSGSVGSAFVAPTIPPQVRTATFSGGLGYQLQLNPGPGLFQVKSISGTYECAATPECFLGASASGSDTFAADSRFVGTGSLIVVPFAAFQVTGAGREEAQFYSNTVSGRITYFFDPAGTSAAPEPAAWAMMLVGFGAIGSAMRSRRKEQSLSLN